MVTEWSIKNSLWIQNVITGKCFFQFFRFVTFSLFAVLTSTTGQPDCVCLRDDNTRAVMICRSASCQDSCSLRDFDDEGKLGALLCWQDNNASVAASTFESVYGRNRRERFEGSFIDSLAYFRASDSAPPDCRCQMVFSVLNITAPFVLKAEHLRNFLRYNDEAANISVLELSRSRLTAVEDRAFDGLHDSLTDLDLSGNNIRRLSWKVFSSLRNLNCLNLSSNAIANFEECVEPGCAISVITLDVSNNRLYRLPAFRNSCTKFDNIEILDASENEIKTLHFVAESLKELHLSKNQVRVIKSGVFTSVQNRLAIIDLSSNDLTSVNNLTFVDLVSIRLINLSHNSIENIEASAFYSSTAVNSGNYEEAESYTNITSSYPGRRTWPALHVLDLSHNRLRRVADAVFTGPLRGVRILRLGNNRLQRVSRYLVEQLTWLEVLELQHNELAWLDVGTFASPTLRRIDLSHNDLRKLISMTFLYLPAVTHVDVSYNAIGYLYRYAFYRICKESSRRIDLSFRGNRLQTDAVWKLLSLLQHQGDGGCVVEADLRENQVTHLMGIDAMQWLKGLVAGAAAAEGAAREVSRFEFWSRLRIDVSRNPIECDCQLTDELALVTRVTALLNASSSAGEESTSAPWWGLNCSQPPVFQGFSVGEFLAYSVCPVEIGSYASCPAACDCRFDVRGRGSRYLNCSRRHLSTVPAVEPTYFNAVDLSFNDLTEIPESYFQSAKDVVYLDLSHNRLRSLPASALARMPALRQLFLHQNDLEYLPSEIENLRRLRSLSIQGNPLSCDCGYDALRSITTTLRRVVSDLLHVRCADGRLLWRLNLTQAPNNSNNCRPTTPASFENSTQPFSPLVVVIASLALIAVTAVVVVLLSRPKSGNAFNHPPRGSWKKLENQDDQQLLRYDIFVSYCDQDDAWVTGTLLDAIWSESTQYSVSLQQQQQFPDNRSTVDLPAADNFRRNIESSKVTIVVLSDRFLKTLWADNSYRSIILEKLESQRHQFIFIHLEKVDVQEQAADLHGLLPSGDKTLRATDPLFAEKLAYRLPSPLRPSGSSATEDHADPTSGLLLVELTDGPPLCQVKCSREKY